MLGWEGLVTVPQDDDLKRGENSFKEGREKKMKKRSATVTTSSQPKRLASAAFAP